MAPILPKAATQQYVWKHVDQTIFRVPEVYRFFQDESIGYLIMEYIDGINMSTYLERSNLGEQNAVVDKIVEALDYLATIPMPVTQGPGPVGGSPPRGYLWSDSGISSSFATISEMQNWLNQLLTDYLPNFQGNILEFTSANLVVCHTDLAPRNILYLRDGRIALLDWGSAGFYPRVFELYALRTRLDREPIFRSIIRRIRKEEEYESQIQLLAQIERILLLYGDIIDIKLAQVSENFKVSGVQKSQPPPYNPRFKQHFDSV
ncbi:uncharacterized protein RAG0_12643 [Rhynchosporium agropyri]|uniref:Aminoglycoside phosphotransferase domain-containing protein n=1 Tax=Rhynchosporium agropyri TaxID=914238 RepID=A0A1E1L905_9HELO|nr:uncharacterized protein RAG0_12643 [Rhynchosporium agropyri]